MSNGSSASAKIILEVFMPRVLKSSNKMVRLNDAWRHLESRLFHCKLKSDSKGSPGEFWLVSDITPQQISKQERVQKLPYFTSLLAHVRSDQFP